MIDKVTITTTLKDGSTEELTFHGDEGIALAAKLTANMIEFGDAEFRKMMDRLQSQPRGALRRGCLNCGYVGPQT